MQYIKHYYVNQQTREFCCNVNLVATAKYKVHPLNEYSGLDVKVWLTDSEGIEVMLSELPDSTSVSDLTVDGKKAVQVLTSTQFNSVLTPYNESMTLAGEAQVARLEGDTSTADTKQAAADTKYAEAQTAIRAL